MFTCNAETNEILIFLDKKKCYGYKGFGGVQVSTDTIVISKVFRLRRFYIKNQIPI